MTEKFPKPIEEIKPCIQEVLWILSRINMKEKNISRQIIVKLLKTIAKREKIIVSDQESYYCQLSHNVLQLTF